MTTGGPSPMNEVSAILITLEMAGDQALWVLLAADGTVNRLGTGSVANRERDLYIGVTEGSAFRELVSLVKEEWLEPPCSYAAPNPQGLPCELTLAFQLSDGRDAGIAFTYGSKSQGPPQDIRQFVSRAVELTEPWYEQQKRLAHPRRPWWKIW